MIRSLGSASHTAHSAHQGVPRCTTALEHHHRSRASPPLSLATSPLSGIASVVPHHTTALERHQRCPSLHHRSQASPAMHLYAPLSSVTSVVLHCTTALRRHQQCISLCITALFWHGAEIACRNTFLSKRLASLFHVLSRSHPQTHTHAFLRSSNPTDPALSPSPSRRRGRAPHAIAPSSPGPLNCPKQICTRLEGVSGAAADR